MTCEAIVARFLRTYPLFDDGSQIVGASEELWRRSDLPLRTHRALKMESANGSVTTTLGMIENLPVKIGGRDGFTVYVQAQVVPNAPYNLLLGRPFHRLTAAIFSHNTDGSVTTTFQDPNSNNKLTLPALPRSRVPCSGISNVDFH
ncbi:hypothetical protein FA15DRAFT_605301 [Coprinopsis marcescibilis]|uniref:Uncharacterized protein n=1 Tax=Coprinopsis marcescibilis TaxID=230819 RepID=A0A5C3KC54_COPMA|nr:hypothetical protein FA15DRAFT_605301 [Coprinopsis marcescibilis]